MLPAARGRRPAGRCVPALLAAALLALLPAGAARASCAAPDSPLRLDGTGTVFAGEVVSTSSRGRVAEVRVLDVWQGRDLPPVVVVQGGPVEHGTTSSTERSYDVGTRYAFFPVDGPGGALVDSVCSPTAELASLRALDPSGVRPPRATAPAVPDPRSWTARHVPDAAWVVLPLVAGALLWRWRAPGDSAPRGAAYHQASSSRPSIERRF